MDMLFFEKPGCGNNQRQKARLHAAGHELEVRNLLAEPWSAPRLRLFFGVRPVADWFNRAAPRVKSGEICPEQLDGDTALALMLADPLLIRRPLIAADGDYTVGFDAQVMARWRVADDSAAPDEGCLRAARGDHRPCAPPSHSDGH